MSLSLLSGLGDILGVKVEPISLAQRLWNLARARRFQNDRPRRFGVSAKTHGRTYEDIGGRSRRGKLRGTPRYVPSHEESPNQYLARKRRERHAAV